MSLSWCDGCGGYGGTLVDTDAEPECYDNPQEKCLCCSCREEIEEGESCAN